MKRSWTARRAGGLAVMAISAFTIPAAPQQPYAADAMMALAPTGPHAVGRRLLHWVDTTRREPTDSTHARALMVWMWYPAAAAWSGAPEPALAGDWGARHAEESVPKVGADAAAALRTLRVHARTDAPLAPEAAALPVLLFFPGLGWLPSDYSTLAEDLASHGYVVLGVASTSLSGLVQFPDGREMPRVLGAGPRIGTDQAHAHDDALFAVAHLRKLAADGEDELARRLDLTRVGAFGHSIGGTTSLLLAARDPSIRAALNLDGDAMGAVRDVRPRQPILLLSSDVPSIDELPRPADAQHLALAEAGLARSEQRRTAEWEQIAQQSRHAVRLRLLGARHSNFSDLSLIEALVPDPTLRWQRFGPLAGERALRVTRDVVRDFFDREVRGMPAGSLVRPERLHAELRREHSASLTDCVASLPAAPRTSSAPSPAAP
jgi:dienelactone hydrolase